MGRNENVVDINDSEIVVPTNVVTEIPITETHENQNKSHHSSDIDEKIIVIENGDDNINQNVDITNEADYVEVQSDEVEDLVETVFLGMETVSSSTTESTTSQKWFMNWWSSGINEINEVVENSASNITSGINEINEVEE